MDPAVLNTVFTHWIRSFVFTLIIEVPIFILMVRGTVPLWRGTLAGAAGTCITHPCLWFVWPFVVSDYTLYIISGELLVATIESFVFFAIARPVRLSKAFASAFIANAASYAAGVIGQTIGLHS